MWWAGEGGRVTIRNKRRNDRLETVGIAQLLSVPAPSGKVFLDVASYAGPLQK